MGVAVVGDIIGAGIVADVVGGALTGAVVSGVMGGDIGMGALTGGIGGGIMNVAGYGGGMLNYGNNSVGSLFSSPSLTGAPGTTMGVDQIRQAVAAYDAAGMNGVAMVAQATGNTIDAVTGAMAGLTSGISTAAQGAFSAVSSGALGGLMKGGTKGVLGTLGNVAQIGSGIYNMMNPPENPKAAQQNADPWSQYRAGAATQLNQLMNNPNMVYGMPGYQFSQEQGVKDITRARAATGNLASGNTLASINQFGQQNAQNWWNQYVSTLGTQAGVSNASLGVQANQFAQNKNDVSQTAALQNIMAGAVGLSQAGFFG
jgi:hypothetical protein